MRGSTALLLLLGLLRMVGDACGSRELFGLGFASAASPAPEVFTTVGGMEVFAHHFTLVWERPDGTLESLVLVPEVYARVKGPYNRRNAYGAALAAAPVLLENPVTAPMCRSVLVHALSGDAPLLRELGVEVADGAPLALHYRHRSRRAPGDPPEYTLELELGQDRRTP